MQDTTVGLFGIPPQRITDIPAGARQFAPAVPGSAALETETPGALTSMTMLAPPGTIERRHALAAMLRALAPAAPFTVLAAKTKGGARLADELAGFGCAVEQTSKAHHRICRGMRPAHTDEATLTEALEAGAPRRIEALGLWSQPGLFSWDRIDAGTALLVEALPALHGRGADLGCGIGMLAHAMLSSAKITSLDLIDIDRRAVEVAQRNVDDARVRFVWADVRSGSLPDGLDFVAMNPPFHDGGQEDRSLGQIFIRRAAASLRAGGTLWLVANRHLPYEAELTGLFRDVRPGPSAHGFKVLSAVK